MRVTVKAKKSLIRWIMVMAILGVVMFSIASVACFFYVHGKVEQTLTIAEEDLKTSIEDSISRSLSFVANAIVRKLHTAKVVPTEQMQQYCLTYDLDELNIADTNGIWIASSDPRVVGKRLDSDVNTRELLQILKDERYFISQPFRKSASDDTIVRKYVAHEFDDHSGIIEVGYDESRMTEDYWRSYGGFVSDWRAVDSHFYVVLDSSQRIFDCDEKYTFWRGKTFEELGVSMKHIPDAQKTFVISIGNESFYSRHYLFAGYRFVTMLPKSEFNDVKILVMTVTSCVFIIMFSWTLWARRNENRRRAAMIALERAEEERRQQDLKVAKSIQKSSLPVVFPPYPRDLLMDVYARMDPARDVGGDFYDFFYVGRDRMAVLVADVSGKGVPAAMFMMKAKTVLRSLLISLSDLGDAIKEANMHLCEGNDVDMFVTCWVGILDEHTGGISYVNAGHNPPYILHQSGTLETLDKVSGMFLGGMPGINYKTYRARLEPGDSLFLFTDGVTEANNVLGQMFGERRLEEALRGERGAGLSRFTAKTIDLQAPTVVCKRVRDAVDAFAGEAAQFDDITLLSLRYRGSPRLFSKTVPATLDNLSELSAFAENILNEIECSTDKKSDLMVALDEVANNVASYSGSPNMTLQIEIAKMPDVVRFRVIDSGLPWNPLDHLDPDITLGVEERAIGGLGILMVKKLMDDVAYVRTDGKNVFSFRKKLTSENG